MRLRQQITFLTSASLIVPALLIGTVSIYHIQKKTNADIEAYQKLELDKLKLYLKHITDVGYSILEFEHNRVGAASSKASGQSPTDQLMADCLAKLAQIRFDNGEGYFWITDNKLPYPTMLMHAEKTDLKGKVLDDPKYNVERANGRNIYQMRAELANANNDAYVEYVMKKPGIEKVYNKISYSRLYKPLGWIISTGFYTDHIDEAVEQKKLALSTQIREIISFVVGFSVVILSLGLSISFYFSNQLTRSIVETGERLKVLAAGQSVDQLTTQRNDEVGDMTKSLNLLAAKMKAYALFANEIGRGNFNQTFSQLSEHDSLGNELLTMRDSLKKGEADKSIREWTSVGLAKIGDVLRRNNADTKTLAHEILIELIKYLNANQGGLFIVTDHTQDVLELVAAYAYERKKFLTKKISFGEGLIGQCLLEGETVYLKEIPENYLLITSGLGGAPPRFLLLVPLIDNKKKYGVLEIASFNKFEPHQIAFIENVCGNIANTISSVQANENTKMLLEKSQQMAEEMKAQEEEMRQNLEELSATQEQMARQLAESKRTG